MKGYKILTNQNCSPIHGRQPLFPLKTKFPFTLPKVELNTTNDDCGAGWNFCATVRDCLGICKLFSKSGISRIFQVEGSADSIIRKTKIRCSQLTIIKPITLENFINCEPNKKEKELFEWLELPIKLDKTLVEESLKETLKIKNLLDWKVDLTNHNYIYYNCNNHNDYYYNHNDYNEYNYNYNNYNYNYYNHYNYVLESLFEPNKDFRKFLIEAYKAGMFQLRFNEVKKTLLAITR